MKENQAKYWDKPWSLIDGCTPASPACDHCWLAGIEHRFRSHKKPNRANPFNEHLTNASGKFTGRIRIREDRIDIPLRTRKPTVYAIWSDLFHEKVPDDFIEKAYRVMFESQGHTFLILTKRPERMEQYWLNPGTTHNLIWHGTTVENQQQADKRLPHLLKVPGNRFLSIEPMLEPVDIQKFLIGMSLPVPAWSGDGVTHYPRIHSVIVGGESGPGARPIQYQWVVSLRDQCEAAGVPFFFKQWHKKSDGRIIDGREHNDLPWRKS